MPNELLPTNIGFGTVVGRFGSAPLIAGDADGLPDFSPAAGLTVTFTPSTAAVIDATASPAPVTIEMVPIVCGLDTQGYLVGGDGQRGVKLIATDDTDINPSGWTYSVTFLRGGAKVAAFRDFSMSLPAGVTKDIALTIPVPSSSGVSLSQAQAAEAAAVSAASAASAAAATAVAATVTKVDKGALLVSVADYSPIGDGVTDDTAAIQAAANAAATSGRALYIPGTYRVAGTVNISTSVVCDGTIIVDTADAAPRIHFVRTATPVTLTPSSLGGLTAGSRNITGLGGARGTLALVSTEHILERNNGVGQHYDKVETQSVVNALGDIMPALDNTYTSSAALTAVLHPYAAPITVDRLKVSLVGSAATTADHHVGVYRSDVTFNELTVTNTTSLQPTNAVRVDTATGVVFNSPKIHGFDKPGLGYGIAAYSCANIRVNNGTVTRCRHTLSGLNNKGVILDGGNYDGGIDTHWGSDTRLLNLTSNIGAGLPHVGVAGKDLTIKDCKFNGGRVIVGIRLDSPEFGGSVLVENVNWSASDTGSVWVVGYGSASQAFFDYGRPMVLPARTAIRNVTVNIDTTSTNVFGVYAVDQAYPRTYWQSIDIDRVQVLIAGAPAFWVAAILDKDSANHAASTVGTVLNLNRLNFTTSNNDNVIIRNTGDVTDGRGFALTVTDCQSVHLQLPENGMVSTVLRTSSLLRLRPVATSANPLTGSYLADGCTLTCAFSGKFLLDFRNNTWVGTSTSATLTIDQRVKSYTGNARAVGATGYPATIPDGYQSPTFYAAAATTAITYNTDGSVATVTDNGVLTSYTYNTDGTVNTDSSLGVTRTYSYDGVTGNLIGIA